VPGSRVVLGHGFFRTAKRLHASETAALTVTLAKLNADWPDLPTSDDVKDIVAPTTPCWRRRVGASAWWLYYELRADRVVVVAVAVPP
jgi:hypothetical protein